MSCKKRNDPNGLPSPSSLPPKRLMYVQDPDAQSGSSLDFEPTRFVQRNFAPSHSDPGYSTSADHKFAVAAVGKRSYTRSWRTIDVEECSKRSRVEYSDAAVSEVTFEKDLNLYHSRKPDAESDSASVSRHVGSCHDSCCLNSKRSKLGEIRSNETDVDKPGVRCNEICSRAQKSRSNMSVARQGIRETIFSSTSCCGKSRDGSHSDSGNTYFLSRVRDSSLTHLRKAVAGNHLVSSRHVISPQISSKGSPFLSADAIHTKGSPPSFVLSSGRLSLEEEARLGRRLPTIDDDFEEYFSSLML